MTMYVIRSVSPTEYELVLCAGDEGEMRVLTSVCKTDNAAMARFICRALNKYHGWGDQASQVRIDNELKVKVEHA